MADSLKKSSLLRAAVDSLAHGNHAEAVRLCKQALKQDRHNYDAFVVLGKALFASTQYDQADMSYRRAVELNASGLRAWQGLTEVHEAACNHVKVVEACEAIIQICKNGGDLVHLAEYTRKLAVAHATMSNLSKAHETWQSLLNIPSISEVMHLEALCGIVDANACLIDSSIEEDCSGCPSQDKRFNAASDRQDAESKSSTGEEICRLEEMLWSILKQLPHAEKYENLLFKVLIYQMRASSSSTGLEWRHPRMQILRLCLRVLSEHVSTIAIAILLTMCEEDGVDELFLELGMPHLAQGRVSRILILGKKLAHVYPDQGLVISTLAFAMHHSSSCSRNLGQKRACCEHALKVVENSIIGWEVLAELRAAEVAYSSSAECIRRGLQVIARFRSLYGLTLQFAELRLQLILGDSLVQSGAYNEAYQVFQDIEKAAKGIQGLESYKMLTSALQGQVKVLLGEGRVQEATTSLCSLLAIDVDNSWALAEQGWLAFQNKDLNQAVRLLEKAVTLTPENPRYHYRLGFLYWTYRSLLHCKEKSLSHLLESARLDSSQPDVFRILGHYYRDIPSATRRAIRCYQKAVLLNCEDEEAGEALCDLLDKECQELLEITVCREASQRSPRSFWAFRRLGYIQVTRKEWSEAVRNLQHAVRGYPTCADVWEALGIAYQQLGMLTAALKAYGRVTTMQGNCSIYALEQSGSILLTLGQYRKALNMFQDALERAPEHLPGQYGLASAFFGQARECRSMGAITWSASLLKEASLVSSHSAAKHGNIASLWKLLGDIEANYAKVFPWSYSCGASNGNSTNVSETDQQVPEIFASSLDSWNKQRILAAKRAKRAYEQALHLQPWKANLYADLCLSMELVSFLDEGGNLSLSDRSLAMEAVACGGLALESSNIDLWTSLGGVASHKGVRQHALVEALHVDGNHALAWAHLGQLYLKEGHHQLARDAFSRARIADPTLPLPWAAMSVIYILNGSNDYQEAFASSLYAVELSPIVEFQLGLANIAAATHQLHRAEVYAAVDQAVLQAPHRPEVHNFKGLVCELKGDYKSAVAAFRLARHAVNHSPLGKSELLDRRRVVSINLARVLCKAEDAKTSVQEYEMLAKSGDLEESSTLRGYAAALWQFGKKKLAISIASMSVKKSMERSAISASMILFCKFIYSLSGPAAALAELNFPSMDFQIGNGFALTAFAIASSAGKCNILLDIISKYDVLFTHKNAPEFISLVAASMQICQENNEKMDYNNAVLLTQKIMHMYPQSLPIRTQLMQLLLQRSDGKEVNVAARCCCPNFLIGKASEVGRLCALLGAAAIACSACGGIKPQSTFSPCIHQCKSNNSSIQELQRWVHMEPWNLSSHYYLVLCLMQQAREQRFPVLTCQMLQRMTAVLLTRMESDDSIDLSWKYMRMQIMLCASEAALQCGSYDSAIESATSASCLQLPKDVQSLPHLQLARCYAVRGNGSFVEAEYTKIKELGSGVFSTWLSLVDLRFKQGRISSLENIALMQPERWENDQMVLNALVELKNAEMYLLGRDLLSAEKAASKAVTCWPEAESLHLLHGAICMEIFKNGCGSKYLSTAVRSLSKVLSGGGVMLPVAGLLLAQAESGKGGTAVVKWENYVRAEWSIWSKEHKPAELYFQMGLLAKRLKCTTPGNQEVPDSFQSPRSWFRRAVHINPSCLRYWTMLQQMEGNSRANSG